MAREVPELPPGYTFGEPENGNRMMLAPDGARIGMWYGGNTDAAWAYYGRARFAADEERDALAEEVKQYRRWLDGAISDAHDMIWAGGDEFVEMLLVRARNEARGWPSARGEGNEAASGDPGHPAEGTDAGPSDRDAGPSGRAGVATAQAANPSPSADAQRLDERCPMELREQIARRLRAEHWGITTEQDAELMFISAEWLRAADECIRLMEWARRECPGWYPLTNPADLAVQRFSLLTLPPDSWRPDGRE